MSTRPEAPIRVKKMGRYFTNGDSIVVFADNDPDDSSDDTILSGVVSNISTALTETCTGTDTAQSLVVPDLAAALANDTVRLGAPVRGFTIYTYGLYLRNGEYYLARGMKIDDFDLWCWIGLSLLAMHLLLQFFLRYTPW